MKPGIVLLAAVLGYCASVIVREVTKDSERTMLALAAPWRRQSS